MLLGIFIFKLLYIPLTLYKNLRFVYLQLIATSVFRIRIFKSKFSIFYVVKIRSYIHVFGVWYVNT